MGANVGRSSRSSKLHAATGGQDQGGGRVCEREGFKWSVSFPTSKK